MQISSTLSRRERRRRLRRLALFVPFSLLISSASAMDLYWKNPVSGFWEVGSNWTLLWAGGDYVPGPGDVAHIGDSSTALNAFTVTLGGNVSIDALFSRAALDLAGHSLTLASASVSEGSLNLTGASLLGAGALTATGATTLSGTTLGAGGTLTLGGETSLSGALSTFDRNVVNNGTLVWASGNDQGSRLVGAGTLTNAGSLRIEGTQFGGGLVSTSFVNTGTVDSQGNVPLGFNGTSFSNSGSIRNFGLNVFTSTFTNTGLIVVGNGNFQSATNDNTGGTIRVEGGYTYLRGAWQTGKLGKLETGSYGYLGFNGTLDNTGSILDLATIGITGFGTNSSFSGETTTIKGGSVANAMSLGSGSKVVFDGVNLLNGLGLNNSDVTLKNGSTFGVDAIRLQDSTLRFADPTTAFDGVFDVRSGSVIVGNLSLGSHAVFGSADSASSTYLSLNATGDVTNRGAIRFGNYNDVASFYVPSGTFRNQGTIDSSATTFYDFQDAPFRILTRDFVNAGTITLSGGARASFVGTSTFNNSGGSIVLDGSTLDFGGNTTRAGLGTITGTNGSRIRYKSGTLDLGGGTLDAQGFGGNTLFSLAGGTLKGGTVAQSGKIGDGYGGLDGVTLDAAPTFRGQFVVSNGLSFPGSTMTLANGGVDFVGDQSFGGTIVGSGSLGFKSGTFTQLAGGVIQSTGSIRSSAGTGNVNLAGTVTATSARTLALFAAGITTQASSLISAAGTLTNVRVDGVNVVHGGVVRATNAGRAGLVGSGTWTSTGSVLADGTGSQALFGGNTDLAHMGTLAATNGGRVLYAAGTLNFGGTTYDLRSVGALGAFGLQGGTFANGSLLGTSLLTRDGNGGLRNVSLDADLDLRNFSLTLSGSLATPTGALRIENSTLRAADPALPIDFAPTSLDAYGYGTLSASGTLSLAGPSVVHSGASLTMGGKIVNSGAFLVDGGALSLDAFGSTSLVNSGTIHVTNGGQASLGQGQPIVNSGAILADAGGRISMNMTTGWSNSGTVTADGVDSRIVAYGATDHDTLAQTKLTNGGRLYLSGSVDAPGSTFDLASFGPAGSFGLSMPTSFVVAKVANSNLLAPDSRSYLSSNVVFDKGLTLNGGLIFSTQDIDLGTGGLSLSAGSGVNSYGKTTFGAGATLDGSSFSTSKPVSVSTVSLANRSTFQALQGYSIGEAVVDGSTLYGGGPSTIDRLTVAGGSSSVSGSRLSLRALIVASGATLNLDSYGFQNQEGADISGGASVDGAALGSTLHVFGGVVDGNGRVQRLSLHGGAVAPGHSIGTLQADNFQMDAASRFQLEIGGSSASGLFDRLTTTSASLNGTLSLSVVNGYVPTAGTWRFLTASSALTGTFSKLNLGTGWSYGRDATGAFVSYAPVPEPATFAVLGLGLAAVARRRRK